jgi:hypothetical protein
VIEARPCRILDGSTVRGLGLLAILLVLAGCSLGGDEDDGASIEQSQLKTLVLQPEDVGPRFFRFDEGPQGSADTPGGNRSDRARFGRVQGWKARYRRPGSPQTTGPLVIESRADLFESADGAAEELEAIEEIDFAALDDPELGDDARAFQSQQSGTGQGVRYYLIAWREENVTSLILVNGFEGKITFANALELAEKQARRTSRAAEG